MYYHVQLLYANFPDAHELHVFHLISNIVDSQFCFPKITFGSVTGNFFTIALIAGSSALSVKNPGLDLESEHACEQS